MKPCDGRQAKEYEVRYGEEEQEADLENVKHLFQHLLTFSDFFSSDSVPENSFATEAMVTSVARKAFRSKRMNGSLCASQWHCVHCNPITTVNSVRQ